MADRALLLLICVGLLSGCLSHSTTSTKESSLGIAASKPGFATLAGRVQTFAGLALPSANILVEPGALQALTDAGGAFSFRDLPAGDYRITAERLGYDSGVLDVSLKADTVNRATLTLHTASLAGSAQPQSSTFNGMVQCSANAYYPSNVCGKPLGPAQDHVRVTADPSLALGGLVFELVWTPATPASGQQLELDLCLPQTDDAAMNCRDVTQDAFHKSATGTSPVVLRIPVKELPAGERAFEIWVGSGYLSPYPTVAQGFTLYSTVCYATMCADDYSAAA